MQGLLAQILGQANGPRINQGFANSGRSYNDMLGRYGGQTPPNPTVSPMGPLSQITGSHSPQTQAAQTRAPGMFNGLQGLLSNNSNMLMGMGAGILERGLAGGPSGAFQGRQVDQQQSQQRQQQNATVTALRNMRPDMSEEQIQALVSSGNTALLNEALRPPAQPEQRLIMEDANGRQRYVDTGDFVFADMAEFQPEEERPNAPSGYRWAADGQSLEPIEGGPATRLPAEVAGRVAAADTVLSQLDEAERVLTGPNIDLLQSGVGSVIPALETEFNSAQRTVRLGIESALRMMTGAAAPESEVQNYERQFMPQVTDPQRVREQKLQNLRTFMENAREIMTRGRGGANTNPAQPQRLRFNPATGQIE